MVEGRHIKIVGRGNEDSVGPMGDVAIIEQFLNTVVQLVGMRPLGPAQMFDVPLQISKMNSVPFDDEGGVTGALVLSTSHCTIHTWPLRKKFVFDLYSCRDFDHKPVAVALVNTFRVAEYFISDLSGSLCPPWV